MSHCVKSHGHRFAVLLALVGFAITPGGPPANSAIQAHPGEEVRRMVMSAAVPAPGESGRIAFASNREGNLEIYTVDAVGGAPVNLTNNPAADSEPAWSPDGRQLAFVSSRNGAAGDIYVMAADGSGLRRVSDRGNFTDNYLEGLSWSPDGKRLLYVNVFMGSIGTICVADVTAAAWRKGCLAKGDLVDARDPAWSPDGTRIAFVGRKSLSGPDALRYELYVANADGSGRRKIADAPSFGPAWSPDGTLIAFARALDTPTHVDQIRAEIFVTDPDGCEPPVRLTDNTAHDFGPAWSPDGMQIAFASNRDTGVPNKYEIYVMDADGSSPSKLTDNSGTISAPAWQPGGGTSAGNTLGDTRLFVRQHYLDFLGRAPDASGLDFWVNEVEQCGADARCREVRRINVSAAFFLSIEFQQTGFLAYRMHKAAFGDAVSPNVPGTAPPVRFLDFLSDSRCTGQCVRVGYDNWEQRLEENKVAYAQEFVQRERFREAYPSSMNAQEYVSKLDQRAGGVLSDAEKAQLVAELSADPADVVRRASVLRKVAEDEDLRRAEFNRAFVLMQYFGYLRRDPDSGPDTNLDGFNFWLGKLNEFNGNFIEAEMVKAFLESIEYRQRFRQ